MIRIYTDGAALGNPGPGGYAAILKYKDLVKEVTGGFRLTTNNRMELMAAISGLEAIKIPMPVTIYSDSKYVVDAVEKKWIWKWKATNFKKKLNSDLWMRYITLHEKYTPTFIWVKGHNGHPENERCDQLAVYAAKRKNLAIDRGYENPQIPPTFLKV